MNKEHVDIWLKEVKSILIANIDIENYDIFLFGSFARGDFRQDSDIDIGILGKDSVNNEVMNKIRYQLENSIVPNEVDIVDFSDVDNENFRKNAMKDIKIWNRAKNYH